jgi:tetratricopeptide (TPR) repeat protein
MQPTGAQIVRLQDALLSAYPTLADLRPMVRIQLEAPLDAVVPLHGQTQTAILFDLIEHYAAELGGLHRLLRAALADNPGNPAIKALAPEFLAIDFDPLPVKRPRPSILWVNVPAKPAEPLLGRDALLDDLVSRLRAGHSPALSTDGLPGVGKTALAVALAHDERVRTHFTDGVLWGGLGVNPDVVTIQNQWATALGFDLADEPDVHRRAQRLSAVIGDRRVLVVIDDAWAVEAAQALRLASPNVVHLLTSRDRKIARDFAGAGQQVHVPELAEEPAFALLLRLAPEACAADPNAARRLVKTVGELPLAVEVLGGYLAAPVLRKAQVGALAAMGDAKRRLALAVERLGGQPGKRETLDAVIRLSVEALPEEAQTVFWALGAFAPKPATFDLAAAEAVTGATVDLLDLLAQRNLIEVGDGETLAMHQVVHDVMAGATPGEVVGRHTGYYLDLVNKDRGDWRRIESVYEQVRFAAAAGDKVRFVDALATYQSRRGIWGDRLAWLATALMQAQRADDHASAARMVNGHGMVYSALGDKRQALDYFAQALSLRKQVGDKAGEATTLINIGGIYDDIGEKAKAIEYFVQALQLYQQEGDKSGEAWTLNNIGHVYSTLGEKDKALAYFAQALPLHQQVSNEDGEAAALINIGHVYSAIGDKRQALDYYVQGLSLYRQVGHKSGEAETLTSIGLVYFALGEKDKAIDHLTQALLLRRQVSDKRGEATTLNNIGGVYDASGEKSKALDYFAQALSLCGQVDDGNGKATALNNIGHVYRTLGDKDKALEYFAQALPLRRQVGDKAGEATCLNNIGLLYADLGKKDKALEYFAQALPLRRQVGDKAGEATTLDSIGRVYYALGNNRQALDYFAQALTLRKQVGDKAGEATTLNNIGSVYDTLGEKDKALDNFTQALSLHRQVGNKWSEATTLTNIGHVYFALNDDRQSLNYYEQSLPLRRQVGDKAGEAITLLSAGRALWQLDDQPQAMERFQAFLQVCATIDERVTTALGLDAWIAQIQGMFAPGDPPEQH